MANFSYFKKVLIVFTILGMTLSMLPMTAYSNDVPMFDPPTRTTLESDAPFVMRSGLWQHRVTPTASGGSYLYSSGKGPIDSLTTYFEGSSIEIAYVQAPQLGMMTVEIDGAVVEVVNTSGSSNAIQDLVINDLVPGPHILRVYSVQGMIGIDAFRAVFERSDTTARTTSPPQNSRQQSGTCNGGNTLSDGDVSGLISAITAANNNAGTDTICLAANGTYTVTAVNNGSNGFPEITDNLIIEGQNATIARGGAAPSFRFFEVKNTAAFFTLNDVTLTGGSASAAGGAIRNDGGGIFINDSTLSNNTANTGGAIDNQSGSGSVTTDGTTFIGNTANYGGAIDNDVDNDLYIYNSTFTNNQAAYDGGAIHNDGGNLTVTGSEFTANLSGRYGGAIDSDDDSTAVIESSTFDDNGANNRGGAINNDGNMTIAENTVITNNAVGASGWGGAIHTDDYLWIEDSVIALNEAYEGGGIYNRGEDLQIVDSILSQNSAEDAGGALYTRDGTTVISGTQIDANTSGEDGGGIYAYSNHTLTVSNTVFSNNAAAELGGGIFSRSVVGITDSAFVENTALINGGAFYNNSTGVPTVNDTCIVDNSDTAVYASSGTRDFTSNWWGDASGPSGSGPGTGDSANSYINFASFLTDDSVCTGLGNPLDDATLVLSPLSAGPNLTDTDQTMTATLLDAEDNPLVGFDITFTITGTNAQTDDVTTDSNGVATFIYTGVNGGTDTVQATIGMGWIQLETDEATITWDAIAGATLTIDPTIAGPNPISSLDLAEEEMVNSEQSFTATLLDAEGDPIEGVTVQFSVTGPNAPVDPENPEEPADPEEIPTDSQGQAEFILVGNTAGTDTVTASVTSDVVYLEAEATVTWIDPVEPVSTSTVWGRFFTAPNIWGVFAVAPPQQPLFTQTFPTVTFNPDPYHKGIPPEEEGDLVFVPGLPDDITTETLPFTNVTTDENGHFTGTIPAQGNGYQAGIGTLATFDAVFTGELTIARAGDHTFSFYTDDGFILGIGNGASYVSGDKIGYQLPAVTAFEGFPVVGAFNQTTGPSEHSVVVNFPAPGIYPFELDYAQGPATELVLAWTLRTAPGDEGVKAIASNGALTISPNEVDPNPDTGQSQAFTVTAIDGGGNPMQDLNVTLTVRGANAQEQFGVTDENGEVSFNYTGQNVGADQVQAIGWAQGNISAYSANVVVVWEQGNVTDPNLLSIPGWIKTPENRSVVHGQIPIELIDEVDIIAGGKLDFWPVNDPSQVMAINDNLPATTGGGDLGELDTTLLANGSYVIRLHATSTTGDVTDSAVMITVEGEFKPGRVRFSVTDLTIPTAGLPITIGRTYDSLNRHSVGDFGHGWTLAIANPQVDVNAAGDVTLTMPDGRRSTFYFTPQAPSPFFGFLLTPSYTSQAGVYGSLTSNGCGLLTVSGGGYFCFPGAKYEATEFTYIDPYGREFVMSNDGTLQSITDLNGNTLTFASDGITSSAGNLNVEFVRDGQDRITQIIDPEGNIYGYDYDLAGDLVEVDLPDVTGNVDYFYEADHLFKRANDPRGNDAAVTTYDADGRLTSVTDAEGYKTTYSYNMTTRATTITQYDGVGGTGSSYTTRLTYNEWGYIYHERDALDVQTRRFYDENHNVEHEVLDDGPFGLNITTSYEYDENGHRTLVVNPEGEMIETTYNQYGGPETITDPRGNVFVVDYLANFMPEEVNDDIGYVGGYTWNSHGDPLSRTDANQETQSYQYDAYGNLTNITDERGKTSIYTYNTLGQQLTATDPLGRTTEYDYDALGRLELVTDPLDNEIQYFYDGNGNMTAMIDALGRQTDYFYDDNNLLIETRYPAPNPSDPRPSTFTTYDFRGNVLTQTDRAGIVTRFQYDDVGRVTNITEAYGTADAMTTRYVYDDVGRQIEIITAYGTPKASGTRYVYDKADRPISITRAYLKSDARTTLYRYDDAGQLEEIEDENGMIIHYDYDLRGRQSQVITNYVNGLADPLIPDEDIIEGFSYDGMGRVRYRTDANSLTTEYQYDETGNLTAVITPPIDSIQYSTQYTYDNAGQLEEIIDANGNRTRFEYDLLGRQYRKYWTWPNNTIYEEFTYDDVGNLISHRMSDGSTNEFEYDDLNRRDVADYFDGRILNFTYTLVDNVATVVEGTDTTTYTYDNLHRPLSIVQPDGRRVEYDYDAAGNREDVVTRLTGGGAEQSHVTYTYNLLNEVINVNDAGTGNTVYHYDDVGNLDDMVLPNGVTVAYVYDDAYRLTQVHHSKAPQELGLYTYTLDPTGNRIGLTETDAVGNSTTYSWVYDDLYRLKQETRTPSGSASVVTNYDYDRTGNRLYEDVVGGQLTEYTYNALDQMTSISIDSGSALVYGYDGRGNMISTPDGTTYAYDAMDRLIDVDLPDTTHIDYTYDWDGRRIQKDMDTGTEVINYLWDEFSVYGDVALETDDTNAVLGSYALANGQLISQTRNNVDRFYLADGQHSIRALVDDAATVNVTDNYTYKAFGETLISNETTENAYQYTGQQYDELTGLYSLRARYYTPVDGRLLTRDKLSCNTCNPLELNRYVYVGNNPINLIDPSGYQAIPAYLGPTATQGVSTAVLAQTLGKIIAIVIVDTLICFLVGVCTIDNNRNSTCQQDFPNLRRCNQLPYDYQFRSPQGALNAMKATLGEKSLRLASPSATTSGPCPREGLHYNVRGKGGSGYPGSIVCCPCCDDTGGKARQVQRCRVVY